MPTPIEMAQAQFKSAGLPFPIIPPEFLEGFHKLEDWHYVSHESDVLPELEVYDKLQQGDVAPFLEIGQMGHGTNSWAIHYRLVRAPLLLFIAIPWGGAYTDNEEASETIARRFDQIETIISLADTARQTGKLSKDECIIVKIGDIKPELWLKFTVPMEKNLLQIDWEEAKDALGAVIGHLKNL